MVDTLRMDADWVRVVFNPDAGAQMSLAVPQGSETGTWQLKVFADDRRTAPAELTITGSASAAAGTPPMVPITFQVSAAQQDGLLPVGKTRWRGYWEIVHVETTTPWSRGDWIIAGGYEP